VARPRLFTRLYVSYLAVVVICTAAVGLLAVLSAHQFYIAHTQAELEARARLVRAQIAPLLGSTPSAQVETLVHDIGAAASTRITIVAANGTVLAESDRSPAGMENHLDRPEVQAALQGRTGTATRLSDTMHVKMMYVAIPAADGVAGGPVFRTAIPLTRVNNALRTLYWRIGISGLAVALVAALIGLWVSRRISAQAAAIERGAATFAAGDLTHKLLEPRTREFASVAASLNRMAAELNATIDAITREKNEREAVLGSMVEGVLAVDVEERVIAANRAAERLLGMGPGEVEGRTIQEAVRNPELQRFIAAALAGSEPVEDEVVLRVGAEDRTLQVHGTVLEGAQASAIGALIVLNDVTRMKRLESVRRDFVANVSHELKTPVTSIKGFAETLIDGALEDRDDAERFVRIIAGQADRLNGIIEDLLALSSLEQGTESGSIVLQEAPLDDVLQVALGVCAPKAQAKSIELKLTGRRGLVAVVNPPLLEQAVVNLVDNAIKYGPEASTVEVAAEIVGGEIDISVRDHGVGVAREHLPRLFERFYRVDKARSRDLGGTGLGLAIVKHIAQAHGGRVSVESALGQGSTFTIHLPLA
jgi:two-component system phosphate regulon sensor histidine kinase PhoR